MNSKTTTTREYDDSGRLVKEIVITEDVPSPAVTVSPSVWVWPHGNGCWCGWCKPGTNITWTQPHLTAYNSAASLGSGVSYT